MAHNKAFTLKKITTRRKKNSTIGKTISFANNESYKFYVKHRKKSKKKDIPNPSSYAHIVNTFTRVVAEKMLENPDGVFIEGLGYFGMLLVKTGGMDVKVFDRGMREVYTEFEFLSHSDGMSFSPHFVPIEKSQMLRTWTMDCSFYNPIKKKMVSNLMEGLKYNFQAPLFFQYTGQRKRRK